MTFVGLINVLRFINRADSSKDNRITSWCAMDCTYNTSRQWDKNTTIYSYENNAIRNRKSLRNLYLLSILLIAHSREMSKNGFPFMICN